MGRSTRGRGGIVSSCGSLFDPLVLYFCKDTHIINNLFAGNLLKAAKSQLDMGIGGQVETITHIKYVLLKNKMSNAKYHQ